MKPLAPARHQSVFARPARTGLGNARALVGDVFFGGRCPGIVRRLTGLSIGGALALLATVSPRAARASVETEFEASVVGATRNDVRIPGEGGTKFSLVDDLSTEAGPAFRVRAGARIADRHLVSALYAPLRLGAAGAFDRDVAFAGALFPAGSPVYAVYRFDSYRLTYRYAFIRDDAFEFAAGFTGKIRDAEIALYGADTGRKTNTGFVPLLNVHVEWRPGGDAWGLLLDADALAAPQGRAEDVLLAFTWAARDGVDLYAGYRTVEGGADNEEVYNFAWLHYAAVGVRLRL
jgi:hypothetical protein